MMAVEEWCLKLERRKHEKVRYKTFLDKTEARIAHVRHGGTLMRLVTDGPAAIPEWVPVEGGTDEADVAPDV